MMLSGSVMNMFATAAQRVRRFLAHVAVLFDIAPAKTYRPEAHYMRGPGPKWREKHAPAEH